MNKNVLKVILKATTTALSFLCAILLTATTILNNNFMTITAFLGDKNYIMVEDENAEEEDTIYWDTEYKSVAEEKAAAEAMCADVLAQGAVLLENDDALPLAQNAKVSLFSISSTNLAIGGGGSGTTSGASRVLLKDALEEENIQVNENLWNWYIANANTYGRVATSSIAVEYSINDANWEELPAAKNESADAAIFVLTRLGSESVDIRMNNGDKTDMVNGNYLELSENEISVLTNLAANTGEGKTFGKLILIMNTANQVELDFLETIDVDAVLWTGTVGSTGSRGIARILSGSVNPSGRLADIFWREHRFNPVYANFGAYYYDCGDGTTSATKYQWGSTSTACPYVVYQEGIYNGYYYPETRYEDKVMGRANTVSAESEFDYYTVISYPFGYGLSYTTFEYSEFAFVDYNEETDIYTFSVKVSNVGDVAGKEAVQLYLQKPYTDYDIAHGVEKSAVELVAFAKTDILQPNASATVSLTVEGKYLASYDSYNAKTWIVDEGAYYFTVATDSHEAINNIIKAKDSAKTTSAEGKTGQGNANFVHRIDKTFDDETYSVSAVTGEEITNQFDNADLKLYSPENADRFDYISRNNWVGTVKLGVNDKMESLGNEVKLVWTSLIENETILTDDNMMPEKSDVPYPTYGSTKTNYNLIDLRVDSNGEKIPFDDPMWQDLLDQLTFDDMQALLSCGVRMTKGISSINKPTTIDHNGGVGVNQTYSNNSGFNRGFAMTNNDPNKNQTPCAYPCNQVAASTFDVKLIEEYGKTWGEDALWAGYSGLYGPGNNVHRGQYGGRCFEYYSEDPILGGRICGALCKGIVSKGIYVYLKHAILNEQEYCRTTIATWANEQSIREIYLRQCELPIIEGGAQCVMTGYNKIGAIWTGKQGFVNNVLHGEFGMTGFAVTDFLSPDATWKRLVMGVLEGNGLVDRDYTHYKPYESAKPGTGYGHVAQAMRLETHRILYTVVHSAAMNGISSNMRMIEVTPKWVTVVNAANNVLLTLTIGCAVLLAWVYVYEIIENKLKWGQSPTGDAPNKKGGEK